MRRKRWQRLLTKKEQQHLLEFGIRSAAALRKTSAYQQQHDADRQPGELRACWCCYSIGQKLSKLRPDIIKETTKS